MKVGEYGTTLYFDTDFDMSSYTTITLTITRPSGSTLIIVTPTLLLGTVNLCTPLGNFIAYQYVSYTFQAGEVNQAGQWTAQIHYEDADASLYSKVTSFTVDPVNVVCC